MIIRYLTLVHYILLCMNSVEKTYWHVFLHLEAPLKSIHVNFCNVTAVTLLQSSAGFWSTLLFFLFIGVKLMFVRPFKFNSFKKLWTTPPKIWTYYIIYCQSSGYFIWLFGWNISPSRRFSVCLNFSSLI